MQAKFLDWFSSKRACQKAHLHDSKSHAVSSQSNRSRCSLYKQSEARLPALRLLSSGLEPIMHVSCCQAFPAAVYSALCCLLLGAPRAILLGSCRLLCLLCPLWAFLLWGSACILLFFSCRLAFAWCLGGLCSIGTLGILGSCHREVCLLLALCGLS